MTVEWRGAQVRAFVSCPTDELPPDPAAYDSPRATHARARGLSTPYVPGGRDPDPDRARRERVGDESGQRGFGNHREFGARGEGGADQRREDERQGRLRRKRIDERRCQAVQQPRAQPDAAEVCPKDTFLELQWRACCRTAVDLDD